jgi:hypothetical protein
MLEDGAPDNKVQQASDLYRSLAGLQCEMVSSIADIQERVAHLEARDVTYGAMLNELENRLGRVLADITTGRADLQDESHILHIELASDYHSLIMQWMQRIARKIIGTRSRGSLAHALGQQVADFSDYLFRGTQPDIDGLLSSLGKIDPEIYELALSMCKRASDLRRRISDIGVHHEWDFRTETSGVLSEERQEAWLTCDPTEPISFVVAPAYLVQGRVFGKQLVATGSPAAGKRDRDRAKQKALSARSGSSGV